MTRTISLVLVGAALFALTLATFESVRTFEFVHYDDLEFVVQNPHVSSGLSTANLRWAFLDNPYGATGGPLTWVSHMLDVQLFGLDAGRHHLTSLIIHASGVVMAFVAFHLLTGSVWRSAAVAALFGIHPLHVESVAWIAERKDVLSGFFWFATMAGYAAYARRPSVWRYVGVVTLFGCGLLSKPMVATLPFVLLLLDVWPLGRIPVSSAFWISARRPFLEKLPLIAMAATSMWLTLIAQQQRGAVVSVDSVPIPDRLANAALNLVAYVQQTVWPSGLIPYYPYPDAFPSSAVAIALALLLLATAAAVSTLRSFPWIATGWFWFLGTLVPVSGLVQVGEHARADRFTYLPLTGIFIVVVWGLSHLASRYRVPRPAVGVAAAGVVVMLALGARTQAGHWRNSLDLWQYTVRTDPGNARGWANLGVVLAEGDRLADAIDAYQRANRLAPALPQPHYNLGLVLEQTGRTAEAMEHFAEAVRLKPDYVIARAHLATLLAQAGKTDDAIRQFDEVVRQDPNNALVRVNFAVTLARSGRMTAALPHILKAVTLEPDNAQWRYAAGVMLIDAGMTTDGIRLLQDALRIDPNHKDAANALQALR